VATGWALLWQYLPRWTPDWRLHFFALFAWLTGSVPLIFTYLNRGFLPQPRRYMVEMEFSLALLVVFAARPLFARVPRPLRVCLSLLLIALAGEQIVTERKFAKAVLTPADINQTIEYRTSTWARGHLPGVRIMLPGSIGQWANAFTDLEQFAGGAWTVAYNQVQQRANFGIYNAGDTPEEDARVSTIWLKAFGTGAVAVSGPNSHEVWKARFAHPTKFAGRLPALWSEDDVTIYRVPLRSQSLAHVTPVAALVRHAPRSARATREVEKYVAALEDESLPKAEFQWQGANRIHIRTTAWPGQAVSIQVTHHPGWHAKANGTSRQIEADGLGLMWLQPGCNGPCDVQLKYNGGAELRICHLLSILSLTALIVFFASRAVSLRRYTNSNR